MVGGTVLDTRSKIVDTEEVLRRVNGRPIQWVSGYFDPLLAEHARRLRQMRTPGTALAVVIENPPHPLLAQRARAELVAALAAVDYVVLEGEVTHQRLEDLPIREHFCEYVGRRSRGEGGG